MQIHYFYIQNRGFCLSSFLISSSHPKHTRVQINKFRDPGDQHKTMSACIIRVVCYINQVSHLHRIEYSARLHEKKAQSARKTPTIISGRDDIIKQKMSLVDLFHLGGLVSGSLNFFQRRKIIFRVIILIDREAQFDHAMDTTSKLSRFIQVKSRSQ